MYIYLVLIIGHIPVRRGECASTVLYYRSRDKLLN